MPLPIGHGLIGASIIALVESDDQEKQIWRMMLLGSVLANLPDADFLFVWCLGLGSTWHRGFTHSIFFAGVTALVGVLLVGRAQLRPYVACWLAALSHGVLDALTTKDNLGVQFLWPMSSVRYKAGAFDYWTYHMRSGLDRRWGFLVAALGVSLLEAIIFTPVFLSILQVRRHWHRSLIPRAMRLQYVEIASKEGMCLDHSTAYENRDDEQGRKT
jgi:membrane-bound metal-dependent hydrolase YbcI (DUF457 family)